MGANYTYFDGTPIIVDAGIHGIDAHNPNGGMVVLKSTKDEPLWVAPDLSLDLPSMIPVASRQHDGSPAYNTFNEIPLVEFICFGHSHRYYIVDYPEVAPYWRQHLFAEARMLARSLQADQAIAYEFLEGDGSLGAWMTHGIRAVMDIARHGPTVKPADYDPLFRRVWDTSDRVKAATADDYAVLHEAGIEFMRIRYEEGDINRRVRARLEGLIDAAQIGEKGSEQIEETSFWVLDLYGQARYSSSPAGLAAYRCGVLVLRAGARFAGEKIAENSDRQAWKEAGVIVRHDFPKAATGLLLSAIKSGFQNPAEPTPSEQFAEQLIGLHVWFFFFTIDFLVFEGPNLPAGTSEGDAYIEKLAPALATEIVSAIFAIGLTKATSGLPTDSVKRKWLGRIAAALPTMINSAIHEYVNMRSIAKAEKRPFYEVFCSEIGWALVRLIRDTGKALVQHDLTDAMKRKIASDWEEWGYQYWRALIISLKLQLSEIDPSRLSGGRTPEPIVGTASKPTQRPPHLPPDEPVPKLKPGPDAEGNIGMNKLRTAASPKANPPKVSKAAKPARAIRMKVNLIKPPNRRRGNEFSKEYKKALYDLNAEEVRRKWPDKFGTGGPHYICENCKFVHSNRDLFNVDHVWDIQHGGKTDRWTAAEVKDMLDKNDPAILIQRGFQGMVLCKGCNLAKNTQFDNGPGQIPKNAGYANKPPDAESEDMNPDNPYRPYVEKKK